MWPASFIPRPSVRCTARASRCRRTDRAAGTTLARSSSPPAEFVITLDATTEARQPSWPGQPDGALWAYPDVADGSDPEKVAHDAVQLLFSLRRRLELLVSLPLHGGDRAAVRSDVRDLGYMR
jgi:arsenate reductase